ncbi:hypothetical protein DFP79_2924 [Marinomonas balearica]|uniref:Uncharacterized protein n=2 Tax=Marinomonas balearica TaxID=491947 RepID=A0A4R6M4U8_9GAMM|nr:hypothetical protein DFP79_2924 [Marinomonas balearica]
MLDLVEDARRQTIYSIKKEFEKGQYLLNEEAEARKRLECYFNLRSDIPFLAPIEENDQHPLVRGIESLLESFRNTLAYSYRLGGKEASMVFYQRKLMSVVFEARQSFR